MREEDRTTIFAMIDRMKSLSTQRERDEASADLKTVVMMASDPELNWAEHPPVILTQGARTYRAYPILG
jgi:hypothetical protein